MKLLRYVWLPVLLLLALTGCEGQDGKAGEIEVHNGIVDLSGWDFPVDGNVSLDGDWAFYWDELLSPGEFANRAPTGYYRLPSGWAKYRTLRLPAHGCATYRLIVETDTAEGLYSILIPNVYTDYALWVNGSLLHACGSFAQNKSVYLHPQTYDFYYDDTELEIVLQVKNDALIYGGGVGQSIRLGTSTLIHREYNRWGRRRSFSDFNLYVHGLLFSCSPSFQKEWLRACLAFSTLYFGVFSKSVIKYDADYAGLAGTSVLAWIKTCYADDPGHYHFHAFLYAPTVQR